MLIFVPWPADIQPVTSVTRLLLVRDKFRPYQTSVMEFFC